MAKLTPTFVSEWFRERGAELISPFENAQQKLTFRCSTCKEREGEGFWTNLFYKKNAGGAPVSPECRECKKVGLRDRGKSTAATESLARGRQARAWTVDRARQLVASLGGELITDDLSDGAETRIVTRCSEVGCLNTMDMVLSGLVDRAAANEDLRLRCRSCAGKLVREQKGSAARMTLRVHAYFREHGATPQFDTYPGKNTDPLPFLCSCPERRWGTVTWMSLNQNGGIVPRCEVCQMANRPRGDSHPNWIEGRTDEERSASDAGRGYPMRVWGDAVRRLFGFRCAITGKSNPVLEAHHITPYAKNPSERFVINNGASLSGHLHEEFHAITDKGRGTATREQFLDFYRDKVGRDFVHPLGEAIEAEIIFAFLPKPDLLVRKREANEMGRRYVPIFETEIRVKRDLVLSMLLHRSGVGAHSIGARSLKVVPLDSGQARAFFEVNHIQGFIGGSHYLGLSDGDKLYAGMSFLPARFKRQQHPDGTVELGRFSTLAGWRVPGAASRLLGEFLRRERPPLVVTYADRRFCAFDPYETMYPKIGFDFVAATAPSYSYTKDGILLENRMAFQKGRLAEKLGPMFDPGLTERENVERAGYARLTDCGTFLYQIRP